MTLARSEGAERHGGDPVSVKRGTERCRRSCRNLSGRVYIVVLKNGIRDVWVGASRRRSEQPASRQTRVPVFCVSTTMSDGKEKKNIKENGEKMSSPIGFLGGKGSIEGKEGTAYGVRAT